MSKAKPLKPFNSKQSVEIINSTLYDRRRECTYTLGCRHEFNSSSFLIGSRLRDLSICEVNCKIINLHQQKNTIALDKQKK